MNRKPTPARLERWRLGIPLFQLAFESGISAGRLSMVERGFATLTREEEQRRREALARLSKEEAVP